MSSRRQPLDTSLREPTSCGDRLDATMYNSSMGKSPGSQPVVVMVELAAAKGEHVAAIAEPLAVTVELVAAMVEPVTGSIELADATKEMCQ